MCAAALHLRWARTGKKDESPCIERNQFWFHAQKGKQQNSFEDGKGCAFNQAKEKWKGSELRAQPWAAGHFE